MRRLCLAFIGTLQLVQNVGIPSVAMIFSSKELGKPGILQLNVESKGKPIRESLIRNSLRWLTAAVPIADYAEDKHLDAFGLFDSGDDPGIAASHTPLPNTINQFGTENITTFKDVAECPDSVLQDGIGNEFHCDRQAN